VRAGFVGKLSRLRTMGWAEVRYRLREAMLRAFESVKSRYRTRVTSDQDFLDRLPIASFGAGKDAAFLGYLRRAMAERFYLPTDESGRDELTMLFWHSFPDKSSLLALEAERLCRHRFEILGLGEADCGADIDWHRDPLSGQAWQRRPWPAYDLVHERGLDAKRVYELNRHQHLPRLAKAFWLTGDERYAREAVAQLTSWITQNPTGIGVNWHSSLELALRSLSWLWTLYFLLPSEALDESVARRIGKALFAQLEHVHAFPSLYSSPNTHLLGEATALVVGGLVFSDCAAGRGWLARGGELLEAEIERQVDADGVHAELSTWYHCYAVDFYLQAAILARRNERELGGRLLERLERMLEVVLHMSRPDGTLPLLGDDDGGRALALDVTDYGDASDLLSTGAAFFGREDFKRQAHGFRQETLWLLGSSGWRRFRDLDESTPSALAASFPEAGYVVLRSGWRRHDSHLVFDCGGLGRIGGGHGHADALSLVLFAGGRELLVDPGTCVYNGDREWRDYFRSTRAHNTAVVDGRDQSEPADTFRWRRGAKARLLANASFESLDYVAGEHDGYVRASGGLVHRRRILALRDQYWLVVDEFRGGGAHTVDLFWHFASGIELGAPEYGLDRRDARLEARAEGAGLHLALFATTPLELHRAQAETTPPQGWVSRRYGERRPAPVASARLRAEGRATVVTLLARHAPTAVRRNGALESAWAARPLPVFHRPTPARSALALEIAGAGKQDVLIVSPDGAEVQVGSYVAQGELFWTRSAAGALERLFGVASRSFSVRGESVPGSAGQVIFLRFDQRPSEGPSQPETEEELHVRYRGPL
jgi:hypothetical protein